MAALVLEAAMQAGKRPCSSSNRLVVPGDLAIQRRLEAAGIWNIYQRAGFAIDPPGCFDVPGHRGVGRQARMRFGFLRKTETTETEWAKARSPTSHPRQPYAASSFDMKIADPRPFLSSATRERFERILDCSGDRQSPNVTISEPDVSVATPEGAELAAAEGQDAHSASTAAPRARIVGRLQRFGDNVDTDAIIPGEFLHLTDLSELGAHCFHFVRPEFPIRARQGQTIVVAGVGWGTGSSREQAVWALQGAGIKAVIAREFAFIHKRNLVNEALAHLIVDDPGFYDLAIENANVEVDLESWRGKSGRPRILRSTTDTVGAIAARRRGTRSCDPSARKCRIRRWPERSQ
jgi:aconitate hydratase/homoaconitate hydratase